MQEFPTNPDRLPRPVSLLDDDGTTWQLQRKRIDLRIVRRLINDSAATIVLGESGGMHPRLVTDDERSTLWDKVKVGYMGPGGDWATGRYLAHEFRAEPDRRMLFVEHHC
ncbi:hypothetical protein AB0N05_11560 [Nocardia sp. NPDC051030]|uniref:hypothetical protein n=1 Tax=Nocardia sp. NPDC051030 TaxID=3155162 RepID=UPI0034406B82